MGPSQVLAHAASDPLCECVCTAAPTPPLPPQETLVERFKAHPRVASVNATLDRVMQSTLVAIIFDFLDVALFALDMYTDWRAIAVRRSVGRERRR